MKKNIVLAFVLIISLSSFAEDGSRLWLRFSDVNASTCKFSGIVGEPNSLPVTEFQMAWNEITKSTLSQQQIISDNSLIIATLKDKSIKNLGLSAEIKGLGTEGYLIRSFNIKGQNITIVAANTNAGLLYGVYGLLRIIQTQQFSYNLNIKEKPSFDIRILNHWDNLDGTVERGYAGRSIWKWDELPGKISTRYKAYARANASIGINATVLNNVNASPKMLSAETLEKVKAIAGELRPFNIKVYLAINFSSPKEIGGLATADPLDKNVRKWWAEKAKEIYKLIPDFGGFLVKANSEGLPGPMDFGRTHVDGANMIADALKPFGGKVMWRAFVYEPGDDRAKLAYKEFINFDGKFRDNVIIQVKNGPIDFQPREPFSPLFGAMKKTPVMPELQITQEYLGHSNHLVFLSSMWKEFFESDTYAEGKGTSISSITTGKVYPQKFTACAGVANIGEDTNWCGHHFAQSNWYAFGRLAWNPEISSEQIADEWVRMTFDRLQTTEDRQRSDKLSIVNCQLSIKEMLLSSHETCVDYMMPLGLHHIFAWTHHYGPEPWCEVPGARPDWLPKYYHNASADGVGFDRTSKGSNAVSQYFSPLREQLDNVETCPEIFLLWFHHVPWTQKMKSGRTLWDELCYKYDNGVQQVREYQKIWDKAEPFIDSQRFKEVQSKLRIQARDAVWWKDAILLYFQTYSGMPIPYDIERPVHELQDLKKIKLNMGHHN
ncbi:MAG TPA: alpha-glucuronidase family glycosyl hydrolase [Paludibacter sp.]|nr:alpha-glucuronidase family glycosyl hydrolase [Paludibacter sp.]